jgi:anti-anti-sigma factor
MREGEALVLGLAGRLDGVSAGPAEAKLLKAVRDSRVVVLDLAGLEYVSSAGLRVLLKAAKEAKAVKTRFAVTALRGVVREVFEVSGFGTMIPVFPGRAEAIRDER